MNLDMHRETGLAGRWRRYALPFMLIAGIQSQCLLAQDSEKLVKIEVVGANKQSADTVIYKSGLIQGEDLRQVNLTDVMEKLWTSGAFEDIKFEVEDVEGGKKLIIRVTERPMIKSVDYRGGSDIGLSSLKDKIKDSKLEILPDTVYDPEVVRKIKGLIVERCAEKGFRNPIVDVALEPVAPGVSRLVFDIKEGGKAHIYRVIFKGNKVLSSAKLEKVMKKTRRHWMLSWITGHDLVVDKNIEEDLDNVKKQYWELGYKDVFVGKPSIEIEDLTTPSQRQKNETRVQEGKTPHYDLRSTITIPILEGEKYYQGTLKIEGNTKVFKGEEGANLFRTRIAEAQRDHASKLKSFFKIKPSIKDPAPGELRPFDLVAVNEGIEKMRDEYGNKSYVMFHADKKLEVREENGVKIVDVTLKVEEGEAYTVHRIGFEGNVTTKDKVLRRTLLLKEGEPFRLDYFKESYTSIGQLGFFDIKGQEPKVQFASDKPAVDIVFKGQEAGTNEIMFQGGYGSLFGFTVGASYSTRNLGGGGETLSTDYNIGKYQRSVSVSYTEPALFDLPYSFTAKVFNTSTDYDASRVGIDNAYKERSKGIAWSLGSRLSNLYPDSIWAHYTTYTVGLGLSWMHYEGTNFLYNNVSTLKTRYISQNLVYDTTDNPYKPTEGLRAGVGFEYAPKALGTDRPYHKTSVDFTKYYSLGERQVLAFNASYGYIKNLSDNGIPLFNYYRPGGENSVRGYQYGQIGSIMYDNNSNAVVVGGNKQFITNFEYQFKIAEEMRLVFFYDAGNAWAPGEPMFSQNYVQYTNKEKGISVAYRNPKLLQSAGIEFRFFMPISPAPLRLIWARKINPYLFDTSGKSDFQFSIGTTF